MNSLASDLMRYKAWQDIIPKGRIFFMTRKRYPSDITREQFAHILPLLDGARKKTKPRTIDLYDAFCGVLYILKSGCQWRMLPSDFPKWRSVHAYFQIWSEERDGNPSLLETIVKKTSPRGPRAQGATCQNYDGDY
jgi:hypothetical protein